MTKEEMMQEIAEVLEEELLGVEEVSVNDAGILIRMDDGTVCQLKADYRPKKVEEDDEEDGDIDDDEDDEDDDEEE